VCAVCESATGKRGHAAAYLSSPSPPRLPFTARLLSAYTGCAEARTHLGEHPEVEGAGSVLRPPPTARHRLKAGEPKLGDYERLGRLAHLLVPLGFKGGAPALVVSRWSCR